jgi:asparagine synthase (glutamine-hydrolysing)
VEPVDRFALNFGEMDHGRNAAMAHRGAHCHCAADGLALFYGLSKGVLMNTVTIHISSDRFEIQATEYQTTYLSGVLLGTDGAISTADLASRLREARNMASFQQAFQDANGFYAAIHNGTGYAFATVDRVRSIPLFYALKNGNVYLSDDAEWLRRKIGATEIDVTARDEFQRAGYVTGSDTLFSQMKQLQAGESLLVMEGEAGLKIELHRYYTFTHTEPPIFDEASLKEKFAASARASIDRLVQYAGGRQIVVPLSGGYDSRFIASLLKERGYPNVLTFTYGVPGNKESEYSKRVAEALGFKWLFVEYSDAAWSTAWQSEDRWQYQLRASAWTSVPHMQDWLAVRILRERELVQHDCIFVPGHTGDFISGGHIPKDAFSISKASSDDLFNAITEKHYRQAPESRDTPTRENMKFRVLKGVSRKNIYTNIEYADLFEKWEWQERQAKLIINSVRVYECYGYSWWLPLWDLDFMRFWQEAPLLMRKERRWYISCVDASYVENTIDGRSGVLGNAGNRSFWVRVIQSPYFQSGLARACVRVAKKFLIHKVGQTHLLWRSRYPGEEIGKLISSGYSAVGINAYDVLKSMAIKLLDR